MTTHKSQITSLGAFPWKTLLPLCGVDINISLQIQFNIHYKLIVATNMFISLFHITLSLTNPPVHVVSRQVFTTWSYPQALLETNSPALGMAWWVYLLALLQPRLAWGWQWQWRRGDTIVEGKIQSVDWWKKWKPDDAAVLSCLAPQSPQIIGLDSPASKPCYVNICITLNSQLSNNIN